MDLFSDTLAILHSIVSNSCDGMKKNWIKSSESNFTIKGNSEKLISETVAWKAKFLDEKVKKMHAARTSSPFLIVKLRSRSRSMQMIKKIHVCRMKCCVTPNTRLFKVMEQ